MWPTALIFHRHHMAKRLSSASSSMPEQLRNFSNSWLISTLLIVFTLIVNSRYKLSFSPFCFLFQCDSPNLLLQSWYMFVKALALVRFLPTWHKIKSSVKKEYQLKNRLPQTVLKGRQICAAFSWLGLIWGAQPIVGCATLGKVVMNCMRNIAEQARASNPAGNAPPWPLF